MTRLLDQVNCLYSSGVQVKQAVSEQPDMEQPELFKLRFEMVIYDNKNETQINPSGARSLHYFGVSAIELSKLAHGRSGPR
jgi:hypothetical protein